MLDFCVFCGACPGVAVSIDGGWDGYRLQRCGGELQWMMNDEGRLILVTRSKQNLCVRYEPVLLGGNGGEHRDTLGCIESILRVPAVSATGAVGGIDFCVPMECLGGESYARQRWFVGSPNVSVCVGSSPDVVFAHTEDFLFAMVSVAKGVLQEQSFQAYQSLLRVLQDQGKSHLLRVWNYVPRINALEAGVERYQLFNSGRKRAFRERNYTVEDGAPAACALGTLTGDLMVAVLAGRQPAVTIENPRQVSSYHYPRQYGADAPIFSRAAWLQQTSGDDILFVSGTASIVGHQTMHPGDTMRQLQESLRNIEAVLESANARIGRPQWTLGTLQGRVYLRNADDYSSVRDYLASLGMTQFCFVQADICRKDLLVEIEAEAQYWHAN